MRSKFAVVKNKRGLHLLAAQSLVNVSGEFDSEIAIGLDGVKADAKSISGVLGLAAPMGATVSIEAVGHDADPAVRIIAKLFDSGFGEHD